MDSLFGYQARLEYVTLTRAKSLHGERARLAPALASNVMLVISIALSVWRIFFEIAFVNQAKFI
jgi:hypothetical protein